MANREKGFIAGGVAGVAIACGALAWAAGHGPLAAAANGLSEPTLSPQAPGTPMSFADIIQRVSPAVVSIDVSGKADPSEVALSEGQGQGQGLPFPFSFRSPQGDDQDDQADPGTQMFRQMVPNMPQGGARPRMQATGSGFFVSSDGYVITNNHVIQGADTITVRTADKQTLTGKVVGHDPATDLAVIKVSGSGFPFVNFETSGRPRVGDWVVAVGNPFGLGGTATAGIISALSRENISDNSLVDYMQIDAPINKGNSGGPTFDVYGRVVGVNTAIFSPSGGSVGIGFDIPADVAEKVTKTLIASGRIEHGYIGATIQGVSPDVADSLGLHNTNGALVAGLSPGGPASRAGLQQGDVVLQINGKAVTSASDLTRQVAFSAPGDSLRLTVLRGGRQQDLTLRAGVRPSEENLARAETGQDEGPSDGPAAPAKASAPVLGMRLASLDQARRERLGLSNASRGVLVETVGPDSDAAEKGLQPGDLILRAGDRATEEPLDVRNAVAEARRNQRKAVLLMVSRNGRTAFVPLKLTEAG